jgi:hypothetical protein
MTSLQSRVKKIEQQLTPPGEMIVVTCYDGLEGVGWSEPGCETEADALTRVPPLGPHDRLMVIHAWGCPQRGTPHSHAHDPVQRWPLTQ